MPRRGLGRGLEELIPTGDGEAEGLRLVPIDAIRPNPHQPRTSMSQSSLTELADSIREHGVIQPLIVTRVPDGSYQLIAGERRWRASRLAGLEEVPVIVKEAAPQDMLALALVESIQRADLNPLEEALAFQHLVEDFGLSQGEVAQRVGKSRSAVANLMRLLSASAAVQQALLDGEITEGHGRALLGLARDELQAAALSRVLQKQLSVHPRPRPWSGIYVPSRKRRLSPDVSLRIRRSEHSGVSVRRWGHAFGSDTTSSRDRS